MSNKCADDSFYSLYVFVSLFLSICVFMSEIDECSAQSSTVVDHVSNNNTMGKIMRCITCVESNDSQMESNMICQC